MTAGKLIKANWKDFAGLNFGNLPAEQIQAEINQIKNIILGSEPHTGLGQLKENGILLRYLPEFEASWGAFGEQHKFFHPEGNVWTHTLLVTEQASKFSSVYVRYAAVFHDIAKPLCFHLRPDGNISNQGHDTVGANLFEQIIAPRLGLSEDITAGTGFLIRYHMKVKKIDSNDPACALDNKFILQHPLIRDLADLSHADAYGTTVPEERKRKNSKRDYISEILSSRS